MQDRIRRRKYMTGTCVHVCMRMVGGLRIMAYLEAASLSATRRMWSSSPLSLKKSNLCALHTLIHSRLYQLFVSLASQLPEKYCKRTEIADHSQFRGKVATSEAITPVARALTLHQIMRLVVVFVVVMVMVVFVVVMMVLLFVGKGHTTTCQCVKDCMVTGRTNYPGTVGKN
jgi:hypothetical protein